MASSNIRVVGRHRGVLGERELIAFLGITSAMFALAVDTILPAFGATESAPTQPDPLRRSSTGGSVRAQPRDDVCEPLRVGFGSGGPRTVSQAIVGDRYGGQELARAMT